MAGCGVGPCGTGPYGGTIPVPEIPTLISVVPSNSKNTIAFSDELYTDTYELYWSNTPGVTTGDNLITAVSPYEHINLTNGLPYYYRVRAVGLGGTSDLSSEGEGVPTSKSLAVIMSILNQQTRRIPNRNR